MAGDISKLRKMRMGIPPHTIVNLGNGDDTVPVAVILLNVDATLRIEEMTEEYCTLHKDKTNSSVRVQYYNKLLVYECMRDPDNLDIKMAESADEVAQLLDPEDISRVCRAHNELMVNKAPKLELLSQEEFEELKKVLEVASLNDLSTISLIHLKSFHQTIASRI